MRCLFTAVRVKTFDIIDPLCVFYFGKFQSKRCFFQDREDPIHSNL